MEIQIENNNFGIINCEVKKSNDFSLIVICNKFFDAIAASAYCNTDKPKDTTYITNTVNQILDIAMSHILNDYQLYELHINLSPNNPNCLIRNESEAYLYLNHITKDFIIYDKNKYIDDNFKNVENIRYSNIDVKTAEELINILNSNNATFGAFSE